MKLMWKLPQRRQLLSDVVSLSQKGLGIPQAFGPGMIHIFEGGEKEKVHLPLIFNYNGVFCSDR